VARSIEPTTAIDRTDTSLGGVVELVKTYALQETVEPIKASGRYIALGSVAAVLGGIGAILLLLGLLRFLEYEFDSRLARGTLSWVSYTIVFIVAVITIVVALKRIGRTGLPERSR
jgi:hypothetical protein